MNDQEINQAQQVPVTPPAPPVVAGAPIPTLAAPQVRKVSPGLAIVLSGLPGMGHLYLGMYRRAFVIFAVLIVGVSVGGRADITPLPWFLVMLFSMIDSYRYAQFINCGVPVELEEPMTRSRGHRKGRLGFGVFLSVLGLVLLYDRFYPIDFTFLIDWWPMFLVGGGLWLVASYAWDRHKQNAAAGDAQLSL